MHLLVLTCRKVVLQMLVQDCKDRIVGERNTSQAINFLID